MRDPQFIVALMLYLILLSFTVMSSTAFEHMVGMTDGYTSTAPQNEAWTQIISVLVGGLT